MKKRCFKCGEEKPLKEFYKHPKTADGHLNKCKRCAKKDAQSNYKKKEDYYRKKGREYYRIYGNGQDAETTRVYRNKYPAKYAAHSVVRNAIKYGRLGAGPCEECGSIESVHAHHDDYLKPLEVRWLCAAHHRQWHVENGEAKNADASAEEVRSSVRDHRRKLQPFNPFTRQQ